MLLYLRAILLHKRKYILQIPVSVSLMSVARLTLKNNSTTFIYVGQLLTKNFSPCSAVEEKKKKKILHAKKIPDFFLLVVFLG